jgi:hypothetical protein
MLRRPLCPPRKYAASHCPLSQARYISESSRNPQRSITLTRVSEKKSIICSPQKGGERVRTEDLEEVPALGVASMCDIMGIGSILEEMALEDQECTTYRSNCSATYTAESLQDFEYWTCQPRPPYLDSLYCVFSSQFSFDWLLMVFLRTFANLYKCGPFNQSRKGLLPA